jgi:NADH-quinone oxidoreductase subunit C
MAGPAMTTMDYELLKTHIAPFAPAGAEFVEEGSEYLNIVLGPEGFHDFAEQLKNRPELGLDFLFCLSGVDWGAQLGVVYHLSSSDFQRQLVVKVKIDNREKPEVATVSDLWRTAEFHEREAYDLYGIIFVGHPDLRRIFLEDDWEGWPLRKDYVDEVNIVER